MKSTNIDQSKKIAKILLDLGCVLFSRKRPFRFDSGILSPVYVDNRILISYPKERKIVIDGLISIIINRIANIDVIAGVATAGIPYAAWIAEELNLPMVFVRSKPKDHGRGNQVEGVIRRDQKVLVVEDLISTAGSSVSVIEALRKLGAEVTHEIAIYTHNLLDSEKNLKKAKVKLHFLTNTRTTAKLAQQLGFLTGEQVSTILDWIKDPKNWAKKMGYE